MTQVARLFIPHRGAPIRVRTHDADLPAKYAGFMFVIGSGEDIHVLLLRRARGEQTGTWAFPGGHVEPGETALMAACRECYEETGADPRAWHWDFSNHINLGIREGFETYAIGLTRGFMPNLNNEHDGWQWAPLDDLPDNMHPNALAIIDDFKANFRGLIRHD